MFKKNRSGNPKEIKESKWKGFWNSRKDGGINRKTQFQIAFPMMPLAISNGLIHSAYIKYYTDIIGLDIKFVGIIWFLFGIWNAINDPILGIFIDRFKYKPSRGKYTYLLRVTAPITLLASGAMLFAQPHWSEWIIFLFLATLLFIFDTTQTIYSISQVNYILEAAPTSEERISTSVFQLYVGQAGAFLSMLLPTLLLVGDASRELVVALFSVVIVINSLLYFFALKPLKEDETIFRNIKNNEAALVEQLRSDAKSLIKSKPFISYLLYQVIGKGATIILFTQLLYMADDVLGFEGIQTTLSDLIPGLIMFAFIPLFAKLSKKFGVRNFLMSACVPLAIGYFGLMFVDSFWLALVVYSVIVIFTNVGNVLSPVFLGLIIDEDEKRSGKRKAGMFTGMNALLTIPIGGLHTMIFTSILSYYGYVSGGVIQSEAVQNGIRFASSILPAILILIGILPLFLFPITKKIEKELSDFSAEKTRSKSESDLLNNNL